MELLNSDVVGYSISLDMGTTSLSVDDKNVPAAGNTERSQEPLDFGDPINLKGMRWFNKDKYRGKASCDKQYRNYRL